MARKRPVLALALLGLLLAGNIHPAVGFGQLLNKAIYKGCQWQHERALEADLRNGYKFPLPVLQLDFKNTVDMCRYANEISGAQTTYRRIVNGIGFGPTVDNKQVKDSYINTAVFTLVRLNLVAACGSTNYKEYTEVIPGVGIAVKAGGALISVGQKAYSFFEGLYLSSKGISRVPLGPVKIAAKAVNLAASPAKSTFRKLGDALDRACPDGGKLLGALRTLFKFYGFFQIFVTFLDGVALPTTAVAGCSIYDEGMTPLALRRAKRNGITLTSFAGPSSARCLPHNATALFSGTASTSRRRRQLLGATADLPSLPTLPAWAQLTEALTEIDAALTEVRTVLDDVEAKFTEIGTWADSLTDKLSTLTRPLEPILPVFQSLSEVFKYLECPRWLSWLCNLDDLLTSLIDELFEALGIPPIREWIEALLREIGLAPVLDLAERAETLLAAVDPNLDARFNAIVGRINATVRAKIAPILSVDSWVPPPPDKEVVVESQLWTRSMRLYDGAAANFDCTNLGAGSTPIVITAVRAIEGCTQNLGRFIRFPCSPGLRSCRVDYNATYRTSCANVPPSVPADLAAELSRFLGISALPSTDVTTISYYCVAPGFDLDLLAELFNGVGVDPAVLRNFGDVMRADNTKVAATLTTLGVDVPDTTTWSTTQRTYLRSGAMAATRWTNQGAGLNTTLRYGGDRPRVPFGTTFNAATGAFTPTLGLYDGETKLGDQLTCGGNRQLYIEATQAALPSQLALNPNMTFDPCFSQAWLLNGADDTSCASSPVDFLRAPYKCAFGSAVDEIERFVRFEKADWCKRVWSRALDGQFEYDGRRWPLVEETGRGETAYPTYAFAGSDGGIRLVNPERTGKYRGLTAAGEPWDCERTELWYALWQANGCPGDKLCKLNGAVKPCADVAAVFPSLANSGAACSDWVANGANLAGLITRVASSSGWKCSDGSEVNLAAEGQLTLTCVPAGIDATLRWCRNGFTDTSLAGDRNLPFGLPTDNWPQSAFPDQWRNWNQYQLPLYHFGVYKAVREKVRAQYNLGGTHPDAVACVGLEDRVRQRCSGKYACKPYEGEPSCRLPRFQWSCVEPQVFVTEGTPERLEYAFGDSLNAAAPKNVTCPGGSLASVEEASFGAVFAVEDVTDLIAPKCAGSTCLFTAADGVRSAGDSAAGKVLRVRVFCACGPGRLPGLQPNGTCLLCSPGTFRNGSMSTCQVCPAGTISGAGATECTACPRGQFSPDTGATACQTCPAGTIGAGEGFTNETDACTPCPVNTYSTAANASSCTPCAPGTSTFGQDQQVSCLSCGAGFVRPTGAPSCTPCQPGTFSAADQAAECLPCGRGNYSATLNATQCALCRVGTFQDEEGQTECKVCPNDTRTAGTGSASAGDCYRPKEVDYDEEERIFLQNLNITSRGYDPALCDAFLKQFNGTGNTTRARLRQRNNGFCNNGPWNVKLCGYDGGDCCAATCVKRNLTVLNATTDAFGNVTGFVEEIVPWPASCAAYTLACKDPATLKLGAPAGCTALRIEPAGTPAAANATCNASDARIGNGLCDDELNLPACGYDGGDCCRATCKRNGGLAGSCIESNCRDPAVYAAATFVDTVAPKIFGVPVDLRVPYTDPRFDALTALPTGLAASDNDPCFVSNVALVLSQTVRDRSLLPSDTLFRFVRVWRAVDASGNAVNATQIVDALDVPAINNTLSKPTLLGTPAQARLTVACGSVPPSVAVTASEAGNKMRVQYAETRTNGSCAGNYTLRRRWAATNVAGRSASFVQTITVFDTTPPRSLTVQNQTVACVFAQPGRAFGRITSLSTDGRFAFNKVADACSGVRPGVFVSCVAETPVNCTAACTYNAATNTLAVPAALQPRVGFFERPASWLVTWRVRDGCGLATSMTQRVLVRPRARSDPPNACITPTYF